MVSQPAIVVFCIFLANLLGACTPQLERADVPLLAGIRPDRGCGAEVMEHNLKAYQDFRFQEWIVGMVWEEVPVPGGPEEHFLPGLILSYLQQHREPYSLAIDLVPSLSSEAPQKSTAEYLAAIPPLLSQLEKYPPHRLIFMGEFVHSGAARAEVRTFLTAWREQFPHFSCEIVFAAAPAYLDEAFDWDTPDLVGIRHEAPPDQDYRAWFRETHRRLSLLLVTHRKPAIIVESNLIGEDALLLFRNELRFWQDSVDLRGISINTLYCRMALTDTTSYFGLGHDMKFQHYLRDYVN
jgi:hypothetical protein